LIPPFEERKAGNRGVLAPIAHELLWVAPAYKEKCVGMSFEDQRKHGEKE